MIFDHCEEFCLLKYLTFKQGFLRCFRLENRVPRIRENYHRVPGIRENRVPKDPYRVPSIFLKKNCIWL